MTPGSRPSKAFLCHWVGYRNSEKLILRTRLRMELALQKNPWSQRLQEEALNLSLFSKLAKLVQPSCFRIAEREY